jgi:hypothetical protein
VFNELGENEMSKRVVYHGGTEVIKSPDCKYGRMGLDFGPGYYLTDVKTQAVNWAKQIADKRRQSPLLNVYTLDDACLSEGFRYKIFKAYDEEWLQFIVRCRNGWDASLEYDYIEGGVANDRVIDTIRLYMDGLMDLQTALRRLSLHQPNNQICLLNQNLTDQYLTYDGTEEL